MYFKISIAVEKKDFIKTLFILKLTGMLCLYSSVHFITCRFM